MPLQDLSPQYNSETIEIQIPMNDTSLTVKFIALNVFQFTKETF